MITGARKQRRSLDNSLRCDLPHHTVVVRFRFRCGAVEIAVRTHGHSTDGKQAEIAIEVEEIGTAPAVSAGKCFEESREPWAPS